MYARLIENGKLGQVVRNPNYRGVTSGFWKQLVAVGDAASMGVFGYALLRKGRAQPKYSGRTRIACVRFCRR